MPRYGYSLYSEGNNPRSLVEQAVMAEEAGFDFVVISDHYHPWLPEQTNAGFAWSILGAVAQATSTIGLATMVTCPIMRYHPAIVAQMAATVGVLSGGRFTLGLGSGERLNEHITGLGWPSVRVRHLMLMEAIEIITALWSGEYVSYDGEFYSVDDAKVFNLPDEPIQVFVAASGPSSARIAAGAGGICVSSPEAAVMKRYIDEGGDPGNTWGQQTVAWGESEKEGLEAAYRQFRFSLAGGWKVKSELPNPVNFAAATKDISPEDLKKTFPSGPAVDQHEQAVASFIEAGVQNVSLAYPGSDHRGFMRFWQDELRPALDRE